MKTKILVKNTLLAAFLFSGFLLTSCERQEYCAECWEYRPLFTIGPGDVSFCSDDARLVDDFIYDYESWGWWCEFRD